ncbi:amino acid adenylation domain-containing protein, partial [Duganella sp. HSC-15S17]
GAPALLALPTDRPRPAVQRYAGASVALTLPAALSAELRALAGRHGATLFMTMLAGWAALLARLGGQDDIVVGTPVANRQRREVEDVIGFFVNTLALRVRLHDDPSVSELLQQVAHTALDAYAHQDLPFEQVVEALQPVRSMSHSPLFQTMLTWNNAPAGALLLPGLQLAALPAEQLSAQFDLSLTLADDGVVIGGHIDYATDLFEHASVERIAGHFQTLLAAMTADPRQRVGALALLTPDQRHQLLTGFNASGADYPRDQLLHQAFEAQAAARPDAIALVCEGHSLSYGQLNRRANQLAHHLLARGVRPGDRVAVCLERGLDLVAALLAILKAGAAYVPVDPAYPAERIAHMLADSAPAAVLTQRSLLDTLPAGAAALAIDDAAEAAAIAARADVNPDPAALGLHAGHLAYIIYTSGSTGLPKGVMVEHANLLNFLHSMRQAPGIAQDDVVLSVTSVSFDIAALELYLPLMVGARIILAVAAAAADPRQLAALLQTHHVSLMQATPSTWRMLLAHGWPAGAESLKVLCGGEALPADLLQQLLRHVPAVWNLYGPTETTVWSTLRRLAAADPRPSIGRPIANTQVYLLDRHMEPVPQGVAGELYIGGHGVARGYLNRPELTAERFVNHPFSATAGARLYRTGDLARYLADGDIEYLGRNDFQLKLRGFRIEPGEIETALAALPGVSAALVVAREDLPGDVRLVAYIVAESALDGAHLRAALAGTLPDYMVPAHFVALERLPLTANGKLDRSRLPAPDLDHADDGAHVAPATPTETALAALWSEVLQRERIGSTDDFFHLGGHSLLAVQLTAKVRARFGLDFPLRALFDAPTVAAMARRITLLRADGAGAAGPSITPVDRTAALPLSYAQKRFWFLEQYAAGQGYYSAPLALTLNGPLALAVFRRVFATLIARHEPLRTVFVQEDGVPRQRILPALTLDLPLIDLSMLEAAPREAAIRQHIAAEAATPFDLAAGPLLRTRLLKRRDDEHVFLLTLHHILYDGWSMGVLVDEFTRLYAAFSAGRDSPLAPLPIQYADYTWWEQQQLSGVHLAQQLDYWKQELAGAPALLALPTDRPRPPRMGHDGASHRLLLPPALAARLAALGRRHQATLFMVLSGVYNVLLHRYTGQDDLCIGALSANRPAQTESLIGIFVNIIALRSTITADDTFETLLARTRDKLLAAYDMRMPFELLLHHVATERSGAYLPFAQVALNFRSEFDPQAIVQHGGAGGLAITGQHAGSVTHAHFDLKLEMALETAGLRIDIEYSTELFDAATIERMAGHFAQLLEGVAADPAQPLRTLPMLSAQEQRQLLVDFNDTATAYPPQLLVHQLFEAQAQASPDAVALRCADQQLSYGELNGRANQLAHRLRSLGVGPEILVGVCAERSPEMVIALLAVLKAGGAYVPLDPGNPPARLAHMLDDASPALVLAQQHLLACLPPAAPVLLLDAPAPQHYPSDNPRVLNRPTDLAYVIYTSGSTGLPKGAMNQHDGVVNRLLWAQQQFALQADDRVLQKTPFGFDVSVWEFFLPLLAGAQLVLARPEGHQDPLYLAQLIEQCGITVLHFVPSMLHTFIEQAPAASCRSIRHLLCSGEALPHALQARVRAALPALALHNLYGPTEAAVDVTYWHCADSGETGPVPIGRPIANTRIHILDAGLQPVPIGVAGQLHIGGVQVGRGYLNRPELTAERFIADPFSDRPGERLYQTGDLGRWLPDGGIEYLGRNDFQLKIRGFRIELGEIEARLAACDGVREAVVVARDDSPGERRLVAYLVAEAGAQESAAALDPATLRAALATRLADYMLPAAYVVLAALPLTPNGKLD